MAKTGHFKAPILLGDDKKSTTLKRAFRGKTLRWNETYAIDFFIKIIRTLDLDKKKASK